MPFPLSWLKSFLPIAALTSLTSGTKMPLVDLLPILVTCRHEFPVKTGRTSSQVWHTGEYWSPQTLDIANLRWQLLQLAADAMTSFAGHLPEVAGDARRENGLSDCHVWKEAEEVKARQRLSVRGLNGSSRGFEALQAGRQGVFATFPTRCIWGQMMRWTAEAAAEVYYTSG